ncbi:MAG: DUF4105 domain-containing protein [Longimicrobiales bacterium]
MSCTATSQRPAGDSRHARRPTRLLLAALLLAAVGSLARAQPSGAQVTEPGDQLRIYLLTIGPGELVWERFGHNAIRVYDAEAGTDIAYNYGLFDFADPGFFGNFLRGRLLYWMQGFDATATVDSYRRAGRSITVQELNLTAAQRLELQRFLRWNERPENRYYRYDYYRDNCSTRVRDAIDRALGGQIEAATALQPSGGTFRSHTQRLTADDLPVYTGLQLAMGQPIDRPISIWEEMFLPLALRDRIRDLRIQTDDGRTAPLVRSERTLFEPTIHAPVEQTPDRTLAYTLLGTLLGGVFLALAFGGRRRVSQRVALAILGAAWGAVTGILGAIIAVLWLLTDHWPTYTNENVLQMNPLALALAVLLPLAVRDSQHALRSTRTIALTVAALSIIGFALQAFPGFDQSNGEIIGLALPAHLGLTAATMVPRAQARRGA